MSATQHGRSREPQASMSKERSIAIVLACWAASAMPTAPVPAPASSTVRPTSGCGLIVTSSAAIRP